MDKKNGNDKNVPKKANYLSLLDKAGDLYIAKQHAIASRPYYIINDTMKKGNEYCKCCYLPLPDNKNVIPFHFCTGIYKLKQLGLGVSLYFYYNLFAIFILFLMFFASFLPEIYLTYYILDDLNRFCSKNWNNIYSSCNYYDISNRDLDKQYLNFSNILYVYNYNLYKAYNNLFEEINIPSKITDIYMNNNYLSFGLMGLLYIINLLCILIINSKIGEILSYNVTPSRFTAFISETKTLIKKYHKKNENLEENYSDILLKDILRLKENEIKNIENITLCYKFHNFNKLFKELKGYQKQIYLAENKNIQIYTNNKKGYTDQNKKYSYFIFMCCCCIKKEIRTSELKEKIKNIEKEIEKEKGKLKDNFSGCLFLTFNTEKNKNKFLKKYPVFYRQKVIYNCEYFFYRLFCCCLCASEKTKKKLNLIHNINVELAPEPDDILWENLEFRKLKKFCLKIPIYFFSLILISISLGAVCASKMAQDKLADSNIVSMNKNIYTYLLSFIMSCIIGMINFFLTLLLYGLTNIEKLNTKTDFHLSYSIKLTILTFCNNAIIPYAANKFWAPVDKLNFHKNILIIFLCNSFLSPILWLFDFNYRWRKCKICCCCIENKFKKTKNKSNFNYTQKELNDLYERPPMNISFKYSYIKKTLLMTFFYASIFPLGILISLLGFIFCFFIEKYNLAHLYNKPVKLNEKLCLFYCFNFKYDIIIYFIGNLLLVDDYYTNKKNLYIFIIICVFIFIFPLKGLFQTQYSTMHHNNTTFKDEFFKYQTDYQRLNPITKNDGVLFYLKKLLENKIISKKNFELAKKELDSINLMDLYYQNKFQQNLNEQSILSNIENKKDKKKGKVKSKFNNNNSNKKKTEKNINFDLENENDGEPKQKDINEIIKNSILNSFGILNTRNNQEDDDDDEIDDSKNALKDIELNDSKLNNTIKLNENNNDNNNINNENDINNENNISNENNDNNENNHINVNSNVSNSNLNEENKNNEKTNIEDDKETQNIPK